MTKAKYKLIYDLDRDIWNWYYGVNYFPNLDQLDDDADKQIFAKVDGLKSIERADPILRPFLLAKHNNLNSQLNKFMKIAKNEFAKKFEVACDILEKITKHPIAIDNFTFFVTTYPRMVVFYEEGYIFTYAKIDNKLWGMPIDGFLHEGLHFQFDKYWRQDNNSPVSKLSGDDYLIIKESLTVILDEELRPVITLPDCSYPEYKNYRNLLHKHWQQYHDFEGLVEFGLEKLPAFAKR